MSDPNEDIEGVDYIEQGTTEELQFSTDVFEIASDGRFALSDPEFVKVVKIRHICDCSRMQEGQRTYAKETFLFVEMIADYVRAAAVRHGVAPEPVAGAIADEADGKLGTTAGMANAWQDMWVDVLLQAGMKRPVDPEGKPGFLAKLTNAYQNDVGVGNVKLATARKLVDEGQVKMPDNIWGFPKNSDRAILSWLESPEGISEFAAAYLFEAQKQFAETLAWHDNKRFREAVLVSYYKQGPSYATKYQNGSRQKGLKACPNEGGCRFVYNYDGIVEALNRFAPKSE